MHWSLSKSSASGEIGSTKVEVHPAEPQQYSRIQLDGQAGQCWRFAAVKALPRHAAVPQEIYTRELDLIARFQQSQDDTFAFQLDWQLLAATGLFAGGVELWLSVQTDLLEVEPELEISCLALDRFDWETYSHAELTGERESASEAFGPAAIVSGANQKTEGTGVWLIEPTDQRHARVVSALSDAEMRVRLFGHFMEKGVIRRARMRFLFAGETVSRGQIEAAYGDFANSPLPLTA